MDAADALILVEHQPRHWLVMYPFILLQQEFLFQEGKALHTATPLELPASHGRVWRTA